MLQGPGGAIDSLLFNDAVDSVFEFQVMSKIAGRQLYSITSWQNGNKRTEEHIPVLVEDSPTITVLQLSSFPTFEMKYLRAYIATQGHRIVSRSLISKDRYNTTYTNIPKFGINTLTEEILQQFDLVFLDQNTVEQLSASDQKALHSAVEKQGLGILLTDIKSSSIQSSLFSGFELHVSQKTLRSGKMNIGTTGILFSDISYTIPIAESDNNEPMSNYIFLGMGKVAILLIENTYKMILNGKEQLYAEFWNKHIDVLSKRRKVQTNWKMKNEFPVINYPLKFSFFNSDKNVPKILSDDGVSLAMKQDNILSEYWEGTYFSGREGWQFFTSVNDSSRHWYYVFSERDWEQARAFQRIQNNRRFFAENGNKMKQSFPIKRYKEIPAYLIYLVFSFLCYIPVD